MNKKKDFFTEVLFAYDNISIMVRGFNALRSDKAQSGETANKKRAVKPLILLFLNGIVPIVV